MLKRGKMHSWQITAFAELFVSYTRFAKKIWTVQQLMRCTLP